MANDLTNRGGPPEQTDLNGVTTTVPAVATIPSNGTNTTSSSASPTTAPTTSHSLFEHNAPFTHSNDQVGSAENLAEEEIKEEAAVEES
ncbi:526_t:CDS:1, partial [Acaulospora colombiana]